MTQMLTPPLPPRPPSPFQGTEIDWSRPWRRASMDSLVREATGEDLLAPSLRDDLPEAKRWAVVAVGRVLGGEGERATAAAGVRKIEACASVGHVLNEVSECVEQSMPTRTSSDVLFDVK